MAYEGVIKFKYRCTNPLFCTPLGIASQIIDTRNRLWVLGAVGVYADGICYGNVSTRSGKGNSFYITASDTGRFKTLTPTQLVKVITCNIAQNLCLYKGSALPSSESLSHFTLYEGSSSINAVIHIHHAKLWHLLKGKVPTTSPEVTYGSVEMVNEIRSLLSQGLLKSPGVLVMGGHEEGIMYFGKTLYEAESQLNFHIKKG